MSARSEQGAPVGLLFMLPGMDETLRVNGTGLLITDAGRPGALAAEPQRMPRLVIRVTVQACYLHCAKALMRSVALGRRRTTSTAPACPAWAR